MIPVDLQPTLTSDTLVIRPLRASDWDEMFAIGSDPLIWELHPARDRYTAPAFRAFFEDNLASNSAVAIIDRASGKIIGGSRYHGFDGTKREIEIGWTFLARSHWGGGANREAKRLMISYAFTFADTVVFWVGETNLRSRRAVEKIGGVLRPGVHVRDTSGAPWRHVIFEVRK